MSKPNKEVESGENTLPLPTGPRPDPEYLVWVMSGMPKVGRTSVDIHVFDFLRAEVNGQKEELAARDAELAKVREQRDLQSQQWSELWAEAVRLQTENNELRAKLEEAERWRERWAQEQEAAAQRAQENWQRAESEKSRADAAEKELAGFFLTMSDGTKRNALEVMREALCEREQRIAELEGEVNATHAANLRQLKLLAERRKRIAEAVEPAKYLADLLGDEFPEAATTARHIVAILTDDPNGGA